MKLRLSAKDSVAGGLHIRLDTLNLVKEKIRSMLQITGTEKELSEQEPHDADI